MHPIASLLFSLARLGFSGRGLFLGFSLLAAGCGGDTASGPGASEGENYRYTGTSAIRVVATTGMVGDLVANIGGRHVQVESLMGEGVDPHLYKASPGDVKKLAAADAIFFNGLHLEGKIVDILERLSRTKPAFAVTDGIPRKDLRAPPEFQGQHDPHVWFDVSLWIRCGEYVREVLCEFDPGRAADYRSQAEIYLKKLQDLHGEVREALKSLVPENRYLITAHDAFGYFGRAYDVTVIGIQGMSTDSEAGVRRVRELVDFIVEKKIKAVFVESSVSERNVRALVEGSRSRGHEISIGGQLFSDAMGKPGTSQGTYVGMVRHNYATMVRALR